MSDNGVDARASTAYEAQAGAEVFVARDAHLLGSLIVADTIRAEAQPAIAVLRKLGVRTVLFTGDARRVAAAVGRKLGIDEIEAELLPEQKLSRVRQLTTQGRVVAMVGDGINDAPALAAADVGIAMGSGTDVAQESADLVLLGNDLKRLVETLVLARRTQSIIWQNFAGTLVVDAIGVALAAIGVLGPLLAAFIHVTSELMFILNSARLLPGRAVNE
jgi:Cd2+/Zn2+-exporting ATPase/Cu+-exporting ATPase